MNIILFEPHEIHGNLIEVPISDGRASHCLRVLHKGIGDKIEAGIVNVKRGTAEIAEITSESMRFCFSPNDFCEKPLAKITLVVGFPRPIQLRRILRAVVSLGVGRILLCGTDLGEKSYMRSTLASTASVHSMLVDGAMQAKSIQVPQCQIFASIEKCLAENSADWQNAQKFCLDCEKSEALPDFFDISREKCQSESLVLMIGSERGWTENERKVAEKYAFLRIKMGERILRTETAVDAATTLGIQFLRI